MSSKAHILQMIDIELTSFIASYENEINKLKKENEELLHKIKTLETRNKELEKSTSSIVSNQALLNQLLLNGAATYETLDNLFLSSSLENSFLLLLYCNAFLRNNDLDKVRYILDTLIHNPQPLLHDDERILSQIEDIFSNLLSIHIDQEISDEILSSFLTLIVNLYETSLEDFIYKFLQNTHTDILNLLLYSKEPRTIIIFLQLLLQHGLRIELEDSLIRIIEIEWDFLDYNVTNEEFAFFLWYAYLFNLDQQLVDKAVNSLKFLNTQYPESILYNFLYDCINAKEILNENTFQDLIYQFTQRDLFHAYEIALIMNKIKADLKPYAVKKPAIQSFSWPSTELNEDQNSSARNELLLNENSELKNLGYQITGLSRSARWSILKQAVPKLGLKKVAYTIAYNVKLRKGQKNGPQKFNYAITEWEYDLKLLKETYYKRDFTWPTT